MIEQSSTVPSRGRLVRVYALAVLLAMALFLFHVVLLFDVAGLLVRNRHWLEGLLREQRVGHAVILGSFIVLFFAHAAEAAAWGLFMRRQGLVATLGDGLYLCATTISTLGYGDVVLSRPWRQLGSLVGIAGVLKFGCSTAFLFLVMQSVWDAQL